MYFSIEDNKYRYSLFLTLILLLFHSVGVWVCVGVFVCVLLRERDTLLYSARLIRCFEEKNGTCCDYYVILLHFRRVFKDFSYIVVIINSSFKATSLIQIVYEQSGAFVIDHEVCCTDQLLKFMLAISDKPEVHLIRMIFTVQLHSGFSKWLHIVMTLVTDLISHLNYYLIKINWPFLETRHGDEA